MKRKSKKSRCDTSKEKVYQNQCKTFEKNKTSRTKTRKKQRNEHKKKKKNSLWNILVQNNSDLNIFMIKKLAKVRRMNY